MERRFRELGYVEGKNFALGIVMPPSVLLRADRMIE